MLNFQGKKYLVDTLKKTSSSYLVFIASIIFLILYLLWQLLLGDGGYVDSLALQRLLVSQKQEVVEFTKRNRDIQQRIEVLKSDSKAVEGQARHELGLIKPSETFYQVVVAVYDN